MVLCSESEETENMDFFAAGDFSEWRARFRDWLGVELEGAL